eukprot:Skav213382  [mRNA]  locus=scaffold797:260492:260875:- [translate_table: standard]
MTARSLQNAVRDCKAAGDWQQALVWLRQCGVQVDLITYNLALGACEKAMMWPVALHLLWNVAEADIVSFTSTMNAAGRASEWQRAMALLVDLEMRSMRPNLLSLNTCISAASRASEWQHALRMLEAD